MEITFCVMCNRSVPGKDAEKWKTVEREPLCSTCNAELQQSETSPELEVQAGRADQTGNKIMAAFVVAILVVVTGIWAVATGKFAGSLDADAWKFKLTYFERELLVVDLLEKDGRLKAGWEAKTRQCEDLNDLCRLVAVDGKNIDWGPIKVSHIMNSATGIAEGAKRISEQFAAAARANHKTWGQVHVDLLPVDLVRAMLVHYEGVYIDSRGYLNHRFRSRGKMGEVNDVLEKPGVNDAILHRTAKRMLGYGASKEVVDRLTTSLREVVGEGREREKPRAYSLGTAKEMMQQLLIANPQIEIFLDLRPDKRSALEQFLELKAKTGAPFDLKWDDGNHRFR